MSTLSTHASTDWCHLCGERSKQTADVWYPLDPSAENASPDQHRRAYGWPPHLVSYLRVCATCARRIAEVAESTDPTRVHIAKKRRR